MSWVRICATSELEDGDDGHKIETLPPIAVFNVEGEFFAIDDTCSHGLSSLSEGYVEDCAVECIWHYAKFDLRTGRALSLPATVDIATYPTKVSSDWVYVDIPDEIASTNPDLVMQES